MKNGTVYSFEPQPWAYNVIKCSLNKNKIKNVILKNVGISDKKDMIKFCSDSTEDQLYVMKKEKN